MQKNRKAKKKGRMKKRVRREGRKKRNKRLIIKKAGRFWPSAELKNQMFPNDNGIYKEAEKNPVEFWERLARQGISWFRPWKKAYLEKLPYFKWFINGRLNICYNCVDRHIKEGKGNKTALIWIPEPVNERAVKLTYNELYEKVCKTANVLKGLGIRKGDVVSIYLPMIPEVIISMLACARIGAIHSVVFSAFSSDALKMRIRDGNAKMLITCDGYYRKGKRQDLLEKARLGVRKTSIKKILVINRLKSRGKLKKNELWFHKELNNVDLNCPIEKMDSESPLFILYTSGCCHTDTLIQLSNGEIKKISELVEEGGSDLININMDQLKEEKNPITNRYRYHWPLELYRIQTPLSVIMLTPNHPLFVLEDDGRLIEKEAKELKIGEHVLQVKKINVECGKQKLPQIRIPYREDKCRGTPNRPIMPRFLTPTFSQFLGYFVGDGSLKKLSIDITDKDKKNLLFYKSLIEKGLKIRGYIKKYDRQRLLINSVFLARYIRYAFPEIYCDSYERRVPKIVQKAENRCVASFIRGFFDAKGSVINNTIEVTNTSRELIQTIQMLFLRFGIVANYFKENRKTSFGKRSYKTLVYGLRITDRSFIEVFKDKIGFSSKAKLERLNNMVRELKKKKSASMIHQFPINSLIKLFQDTISLPKREAHAIFLDSYLYSNRRIKTERICKIREYIEQKIQLAKNINLSTRDGIKRAISVFKVSQKELAKISGKSINTVHQYHHRKKPHISKRSLKRFYSNVKSHLIGLKKEKLNILHSILEKIKKLERLKEVSFFEIKKISKEKNYSRFVYDLTAIRNHNYIANSFVVHNSTGAPKGIIHDTGGYSVQAYYTAKWDFNLKQDSIIWCTADIGWVTGHTYGVYGPLLNGITTLIYEGMIDFPTPDRCWQIIEENGVNVFYTAPTAIRMFKAYGEKYPKKYNLSPLKILGTVGEPIDNSTWLWYFSHIGRKRCPVIDTWWQTETGGTLINSLPGIGPFIPSIAGKSFPGTKHAVVNDKGQPVETGKTGNLVQLSPFAPGMLRGVWKNPKMYKEKYWKFQNMYLTGDSAVMDKKGYFKILGRIDDVIKVAGHRMSTAEMEDAVIEHEKISEAAVVSRPDKIKGEVPVIFAKLKGKIEKKEGDEIKEDIIKLIIKKIGAIAKPAEIYLVLDLPKTRSGKIMRRILKALLREESAGNITTLVNPDCVREIEKIVKNK